MRTKADKVHAHMYELSLFDLNRNSIQANIEIISVFFSKH